MKRALSAIADNWAVGIAGSISLFLGGLWSLHAAEIYHRLIAALGEKGMLAALFLALLGIVWLAYVYYTERKKNSLDVLDKNYIFDDTNGTCIKLSDKKRYCTACLRDKVESQLMFQPFNFKAPSEKGSWICQVRSCRHTYIDRE